MLLLASWEASADELKTADDDLALPDQPAGNETLAKQSGSHPATTTVGTNNIQQVQQNKIVLPMTVNNSITKTGRSATNSGSSTASITSTATVTVIHSGVQQTP